MASRHETQPLAKVPEVEHILSFYSSVRGLGFKQLIFHLWEAVFEIFKFAIFEDGISPLTKVPDIPHAHSFYHRGSELTLFLLYRHMLLRYMAISKNCYICCL